MNFKERYRFQHDEHHPAVRFLQTRRSRYRDVRLLAALGWTGTARARAARHPVHLLNDADPEIRQAAGPTLSRIPEAVLSAFPAARSVRWSPAEGKFAGRGVSESRRKTATPAEAGELLLVEADAARR